MSDNYKLFGPDFKLPSVEGLESGIEKELHCLTREIDAAFKNKHNYVLNEMKRLQITCGEKDDQLKKLREQISSVNESSAKEIRYLMEENKELKKQNGVLNNDNCTLKNAVSRKSDRENQTESLKRSLKVEQDENRILNEKFQTLSEKHKALQENYQKLLDIANKKLEDSSENNIGNSHFLQELVAREAQKYLQQENEHSTALHLNIEQQIEQLRRTINTSANEA